MCFFDGLGECIFRQKMEKMRRLRKEMKRNKSGKPKYQKTRFKLLMFLTIDQFFA